MKSWHILTFPDVKKKALQTYQTLAHNLFELPCAQKGSVSRSWCSASLLFHPSSSRPWLTSSLPSVTSKNWKKNFALLGKSHLGTRKTQQNDRTYLYTYIFYYIFYTFPPALPNSFPFPLRYFAQVTSGTSAGCIAELWLHLFTRSWDGNLLGAIQLKSS